MKKTYIKISGIINLLTAIIHLIGGQMDLVNPLQNSNLTTQQIAEWFGVWHIVTILLFWSSYLILKAGFGKNVEPIAAQLKPIAYLYVLSGIPFVFSSFYFSVFAPQWILLMPIGVLLIIGLGKTNNAVSQ